MSYQCTIIRLFLHDETGHGSVWVKHKRPEFKPNSGPDEELFMSLLLHPIKILSLKVIEQCTHFIC